MGHKIISNNLKNIFLLQKLVTWINSIFGMSTIQAATTLTNMSRKQIDYLLTCWLQNLNRIGIVFDFTVKIKNDFMTYISFNII